jgi:E3 ubiquitin-protein ligase UBR3
MQSTCNDTDNSLPGLLSPADCMRWGYSNSMTSSLIVVEAWCRHLAQAQASASVKNRMLLMTNPVWYPARLITLPSQYEELFEFYRRRKCPTCNTQPKQPALCLVCSQLVCHKGKCCERSSSVGSDGQECVRHSRECGGGTCVFLLINSSVILIIRGLRAAIWGSVYLDAHSEEDRDLKRGKPLHLSEERYQLLEQLWTSHIFDHACKQWVLHRNEM